MAEKITFVTAYGPKPKHESPTGEKIEIRHRAEIDKNGVRHLIADKKVAIYDLIQSNREECEIERIVRRAKMGDANALSQAYGQYMDITGMPKSIAEAQQLVINLKEHFNELPKEVRAKFEYNPEIYVAQYGTETWFEKTGAKEAYEAKLAAEKRKAALQTNLETTLEKIANQKGEVNE